LYGQSANLTANNIGPIAAVAPRITPAVLILPSQWIFTAAGPDERRKLMAAGTVWVSPGSNSLHVIGGPGDFPGSQGGDIQIRHACADPGSPSRFPAPLLPVAA
jgi:hypothetical protein